MKKLNLGSGYRPVPGKDWLNIDNREECGENVDNFLLHDLTEPLPFEDGSIDEIRAWDILEHIPREKMIALIEELYRVLKPNGKFEFMVPSTDGRGAFQDPTHQSFWNRNTWLYFSDDEYRALYGIQAKFVFGTLNDLVSDPVLHVIHTHGVAMALKE